MSSEIPVSPEFDYVRQLVRKHSSIVLEADKSYLLETRLGPVVRRENLPSVAALVALLRNRPFDALHRAVVEAMMNHETSFFRDFTTFEALRTVILPEFYAKRSQERRLTIWSAACSTGQEAYSIAMLIREYFPALLSWELKILAGDFSSEALRRARNGVYNQVEINRGLPAVYLVKYFRKKDTAWEIREDIRRMVEFAQINLAESWPVLPPIDILFLRNLLIYFEPKTRKEILTRVRRALRPDGCLIFGSTETAMATSDVFDAVRMERAIAYRPKDRP